MHGWLAFLSGALAVIGGFFIFEALIGDVTFGLGAQVMLAIAVTLLIFAGIFAWLLYAAVRAQYKRVKTGKEALMGAIGVAVTDLKPKGEVRVLGEFWQATTKGTQISNGQTVEVVDLKGMFLVVEPSEEKA
jgi:membrane-bound serine protease (ClpP class)